MMVRMFQPDSVERAFTLGKMYETASSPSSVSAPSINQIQIFCLQNPYWKKNQSLSHFQGGQFQDRQFQDSTQDCQEPYSCIYGKNKS